MRRIKLLFLFSLLLLILASIVPSAVPDFKYAFVTLFGLSVVVGLICNVNMARLGRVGKSSTYIFCIASITFVGFIPMLALMGYTIWKSNEQRESQ